jgi:hypothetical protein
LVIDSVTFFFGFKDDASSNEDNGVWRVLICCFISYNALFLLWKKQAYLVYHMTSWFEVNRQILIRWIVRYTFYLDIYHYITKLYNSDRFTYSIYKFLDLLELSTLLLY